MKSIWLWASSPFYVSHESRCLIIMIFRVVLIYSLECLILPPCSFSHQIKNVSHLMSYSPPLMKVTFEEVPELVASRRVFISKGNAYIAMSQVIVNASF